MRDFNSRSSYVWLALALVCAGCMSYYVFAIWSANQSPHFSDLYARWWGAHELLLKGRDPYSPAVSHEIQRFIYGAQVTPSADDPNGIGGGFAYPVFTALLLWPLVHLPFAWAQAVFVVVASGVTLLSLGLWLRVLRWKLSHVSWITAAIFVLGSFPFLQGVRLQNLSLVAAGIIAIALYFAATGRLILGGIFLAISTFKPQFTPALILGLAIWTAAEWRARRALAWSFLATILVILGISEWLLPGWISEFLRVARAYRHYAYGYSLFDLWLSPSYGKVASAAVLAAALALFWRWRRETAGSSYFAAAVSFLLAVNVAIMPSLAPHGQLLLLPGFLCLLANRPLMRASRVARCLFAAPWILLTWEWAACAGLLVDRMWYPQSWLIRFWQMPLYSSPILPLTLVFALGSLVLEAQRLKAHQLGSRFGMPEGMP